MASPILDAVHAIGPRVAERSEAIEQARTLPPDVVELVRATGAFRLYVPADLGGPDVSAWDGLKVMEALAYFDGATGWCAMISSTTSLMASFLSEPFATEIFANPASITGGFAMPAGRGVVVDGGLRVSGRWAWGSGTRHCTWIGGGCLIVDADGAPQRRPDGLAAPFVFFSADDVEFIDNWHVTGLCGTGSGDYAVADVFVPEGRWVQLGHSEPTRESALTRFSFYGLLACGVAACAVGIARRSIDELVALAADKKPQGSAKTLADRAPVQADVAKAEAKLAAAWSLLGEAVADTAETAAAENTETAAAENAPSDAQKRKLRLAATHATQTAAEVAEAMYKAGGGAAVYTSSPLQRTFRDAFVATQHAMVAPRTFELAGRMRLGLDTDTKTL